MRVLPIVVATTLLLACGGEKESKPESDHDRSASFDPGTITPAEIALGDSLFHGLIGAVSCQACHGADAKGGPAAANLTDSVWLHSDGSFEAIYKQIETGVSTPKVAVGMMPPFGGAPMTPAQHRAVAAYVYSLSHKVGK
jgi:mono/diheme cytochrome c family protein